MATSPTTPAVDSATTSARLAPARHVRSANRGDDTVLLDLVGGQYFTLTGTAARVWALIVECGDVARIAPVLRSEFAVPGDAAPDLIERDVELLVADLFAHGLVVMSNAARPQQP